MMPASHDEVPHGEREQGGGPGLGEQEDLEPRGGQHPGAELGELRRVVPGVAGDHARSRRIRPLAGRDVIGQAPGALGDRPLVEHVRADRIHHAPPAARAELQHGEEGVVEGLPPARGDVLEKPGTIALERTLGQPAANRGRGRGGKLSGGLRLADPGECVFGCGHAGDPPRRRPREPAFWCAFQACPRCAPRLTRFASRSKPPDRRERRAARRHRPRRGPVRSS